MPAAGIVKRWIEPYPLQVRLAGKRTSKTGDYRPPQRIPHHRISVNRDLNPSAFLITFAHEVAHMIVWENYGRRARSHGKEWKEQFGRMMEELIMAGAFPPEIEQALRSKNGQLKATMAGDLELARILCSKAPGDTSVFLQDLPEGAEFSIPGGRTFIRQEQLRKRIRCLEKRSRRTYLFNPAAMVLPVITG